MLLHFWALLSLVWSGTGQELWDDACRDELFHQNGTSKWRFYCQVITPACGSPTYVLYTAVSGQGDGICSSHSGNYAQFTPARRTRNPHSYNDKFALVEYLTNTAMASQLAALEPLGPLSTLTSSSSSEKSILDTLLDRVHVDQQHVTLRFEASIDVQYEKEQETSVVLSEYEIEVEETMNAGGYLGSSNTKKRKTSQ